MLIQFLTTCLVCILGIGFVGFTAPDFTGKLKKRKNIAGLEYMVSYRADGRVKEIVSKQFSVETALYEYDDNGQTIAVKSDGRSYKVYFKNSLVTVEKENQRDREDSIVYNYRESSISYFRNLHVPEFTTVEKLYFKNNNVVRIEYYGYHHRKLGELGRAEEYTYDKGISPYCSSVNDTTRWRNLTWRGNYVLSRIAGMGITDPGFLSRNNVMSVKEVYTAPGHHALKTYTDFQHAYLKNGRLAKTSWAPGGTKNFKLQDEYEYY